MAQTGKVEIRVTGKDQASPVLKGISGKLQAMSKQCRMAGMAMTAMGTVIVGGMTKMTLSYAKAGDQVAKLAKKTGFTTEMLSKLRYAAEISGASLDTLAKGVKRMAKTIVDASEGMATYIRSFDRIGLSAEALMKQNPEEQFRTIALAIAGLENATMRAATAQDIFGRAGTELLPLLAEGADGIEALMQKAEELGIVFDAEAAAAAERFNDSILTLKTSFMGFGAVLAENLTTVLPDLIEKMTDIITGIKDWTEKHPGLTKAIVFSTLALGLLMLALGPLLIALPGLPMLIHGVTAAIAKMTLAAFSLNMTLLPALGLIGVGLAGALMVIIPLMTHWDSITNDISNAFQRAIEKVLAFWDLLKTFWAWVMGLFGGGGGGQQMTPYKSMHPWEKEFWEYGEPTTKGGPITGGVVGGARGLGNAYRNHLLGIPTFQYGGIVDKPTFAMLGEGGREAVIPMESGIPIENVITSNIYLDGELVGQSVNRSLGNAYMKRERMGG